MPAVRPSQFLYPLTLFSATGWLLLGAPMVGAQDPGRDRRSNPVYNGWTSFYQPQYGFLLPVPPGMRAQGDPFTARRAVFTSLDGDLAVTAWGGYSPGPTRPSLEAQWMEAQSGDDRRVDYRRWGGSWFEISGVSLSGRAFYEKLIRRGEFYAVFTVSYTPSRLNEYRAWMDEMSAGFTYNAPPPVRRINPDPGNLAEAQSKSRLRRFWSGLIDERPEPRAEPRRLEPWDGGDRRTRAETAAVRKPEYSSGGSAGGTADNGGRSPRSTGPVDLTPPPARTVAPPVTKPSDSPSPKPSASQPSKPAAASSSGKPAASPSGGSGLRDSGGTRDKNDRNAPSDRDTPPSSGDRPPEKSSQSSGTRPSGQETAPAATSRDDLPFGVPIPGKKGFVYSPYTPEKGPVDVQDIPTGTKVRCPYTSKVFRVP